MRKCLRCDAEMVEDITVMTNSGYGIDIRQKGLFKGSLGKLKCAVCPRCGYVENYIENTKNVQKLIEENK